MKAGFPVKKVLITDTLCPLGAALLAAFHNSGINLVNDQTMSVDWSDSAEVDAFIELQHPFLVINTLSIDPKNARDHVTQSKNLAVACTKIKSRVIQISNYQVFGLESKNTYFETDKPAPLSELGEGLAQAETIITEQIAEHMILRLSWILNNSDWNPFSRLMQAFDKGIDVEVSRDYLGSPTWLSDVVRVILGVSHQVLAGAENWGVFHYCSEDKCSEQEFAEHIAQAYGDLKPLQSSLVPVAYKDREDLLQRCEPHSAVLSCRRLRNNFGVQSRTWRQGLKGHIRQWLEAHNALPAQSKSENSIEPLNTAAH